VALSLFILATNDMKITDEETFGPELTSIPFDRKEEAL